MKNKYLIYIGIFLVTGMWACSNDAVYYDAGQKRSIYFMWDRLDAVEKTAVDTVFFSFALYNETEIEYKIPVKVIGMPMGVDCTYEVEAVVDSSTAVLGKHFKFGKLVIPKNEVEGELSLVLERTDDIMDSPVYLYLKFKENDDFKPIADDYFRMSIVDGALPAPQWWAANYLGVYAQNNDRLYRKMLEYFWQLEELKPIFYADAVAEYGLYLEDAPAGFYQRAGNIIWINYVFKPAYDFYSDPANTYEGFAMVNPDRFIR
jgi:lipoprotein